MKSGAVCVGFLSIFLRHLARAQTSCTTSTTCTSGCNVPTRSENLPKKQYTVCKDSSTTNLNNPNLNQGIETAVNNWQAGLSSLGGNVPSLQNGTTGCEIKVVAGEVIGGDAKWEFSRDGNNNVTGGVITVSPSAVNWSLDLSTTNMAHELGHGLGLDDTSANNNCVQTDTVMFSPFLAGQPAACKPTDCDKTTTNAVYNPPEPPPCMDCACDPFLCQPPEPDLCMDPCSPSPILIDVGGNGYRLTSLEQGVVFDIFANDRPRQVGWTQGSWPNGFLAMDRNRNGIIDDGSELFGDHTPLPDGKLAADGFQALAFYDQPENGGNSNGTIDHEDRVWVDLRVWIDTNHNGWSESAEVFHLDEVGVSAIGTSAGREMRRDQYGNLFRLRGRAWFGRQPRLIYDVFLTTRAGR